MSRGFVKEGDREEIPLVAPRAHLPIGIVNYVTLNGIEELKHEHDLLVQERKILTEKSIENNRVMINYITVKLHALEERINTARIVNLSQQPKDEIRFGAKITLLMIHDYSESQIQIVGVDEADVSRNKVSFLSPMAKVLLNKNVGDEITFQTPKEMVQMKVLAIEYQ